MPHRSPADQGPSRSPINGPWALGWALAAAWLTDTTLIVEPDRISRIHTTAMPVVVDHRVEQVWRLPLAVFHPQQFGSQQQRWPRTGTALQPVPDR